MTISTKRSVLQNQNHLLLQGKKRPLQRKKPPHTPVADAVDKDTIELNVMQRRIHRGKRLVHQKRKQRPRNHLPKRQRGDQRQNPQRKNQRQRKRLGSRRRNPQRRNQPALHRERQLRDEKPLRDEVDIAEDDYVLCQILSPQIEGGVNLVLSLWNSF